MCLSNEAFALFLNIIGLGLTTQEGGVTTIHAAQGDVTWHAVVDEWCTAAPHAGSEPPFMAAAGKQPFVLR